METWTRYRSLGWVIAVSLALGLAAGAYSYLSSALSVPGPAQQLSTAELRERGAEIYMELCAGQFEPRWWPECRGGADEKRARGADQLVAYCAGEERFARFFSSSDCESADRPLAALTAAPRWPDAVTGGLVAGSAFLVLGLLSVARRLVLDRRAAA